jgi:hypothetical protein
MRFAAPTKSLVLQGASRLIAAAAIVWLAISVVRSQWFVRTGLHETVLILGSACLVAVASLLVVLAAVLLFTGLSHFFSIWLSLRYVSQLPPTHVVHISSKQRIETINVEGVIRPGSIMTNLGPGVYLRSEIEDPPRLRAAMRGQTVSLNLEWPFVHCTRMRDLAVLRITVDDPSKLIWNSPETWVVREPIVRAPDGEFKI